MKDHGSVILIVFSELNHNINTSLERVVLSV